MRLRHFHADWTTTNNEEVFRPLSEIPEVLIGEVRHGVQSGDRRHKRGGTG